MIFSKSITIQPNTSKEQMVYADCELMKGLIYTVQIRIPSGHAGLAGLCIAHGNLQIWPSLPGTFFVGDDDSLRFDDLYSLEEEPYLLRLWGYNEDTFYAHRFYVYFGIVSKEVYIAKYVPVEQYKYFQHMVEKLESELKVVDEKGKEEEISIPFIYTEPKGK